MSEFDFKSWYIVLAIFIAHFYRHYSILDKIPIAVEGLKTALNGLNVGDSNLEGIKKEITKVKKTVFRLDVIILHILAILILVTICLIVLNIPNKTLDPNETGPLADPLKLGEKIIYVLISFLFFISYILKALIPTFNGIVTLSNAKKELNKN